MGRVATGSRVDVGQSQGELYALLARYEARLLSVDESRHGWVDLSFHHAGAPVSMSFPYVGRDPQALRELWRRVLIVVAGHLEFVTSGAVVHGLPAAHPSAAVRPQRPAAARRDTLPAVGPSPVLAPAMAPLALPRWNPLTGRRPIARRKTTA